MKQREIKFRYFSEDTKEMVYGKEAFRILNETIQHNLIVANLMQYTGLKDKNGVEIYEGDIVEDGEWGHSAIEWIEIDTCFAVQTNKDEIWTIGKHIKQTGYVAVIGNIYENPELLNVCSECGSPDDDIEGCETCHKPRSIEDEPEP